MFGVDLQQRMKISRKSRRTSS